MQHIRDISQLKQVPTPLARVRKSTVQKVGEFLAPTATKVIQDIGQGERPTGKEIIGAGLEVGSLGIPGGAIARGLKLIGKGAIKQGAGIGATIGGMQEAGRALGEDKSLPEVVGEAFKGATVGAGVGAVTPVVGGAIARSVGKIRDIKTPEALRKFEQNLPKEEAEKLLQQKVKSYTESFVDDKSSINRKLEDMVVRFRKIDPEIKTKEDLIKQVVREGYLPKVEGTLAKQFENIDDLVERRAKIAKEIDPILEPLKTKISLKTLRKQTEDEFKNRFDIDQVAIENQINKNFEKLEKQFGKYVTPVELNEIRKLMNKQSKAFNKQDFILDSQYAIANATRKVLDEIAPQVREKNSEIARLFRLEEVLRTFDNKKIDTGIITNTLGSLAGTIAGGSLLTSGLVGLGAGAGLGAGGLVIAGLMATLGNRFVANMIRKARFNPKIADALKQAFRENPELKKKLISQEGSQVDRNLIKAFAEEKPKKGITRNPEKKLEKRKKELEKRISKLEKGIARNR
ncbi:hypothetical protein [Persephonella sp.]